METLICERKASARDLLLPDQFGRVAALVQRDNDGIDQALAECITDEALKFLVAASQNTSRLRLRPSKVVDLGWHALILHTEIYAMLAGRLGRFIHHRPEGPETLTRVAATAAVTMDAIRDAGYEPDVYLWGPVADIEVKAGDCMHSECTEGGSGCSAPEPNPPDTM
ncbi:hypothetical protein [Streptomyces sp. 5-10]|uniref:hypothetical protein n=1 Tax=Streptomyces sp. 5-10 TaxID=878925 RepID=UPI00168A7718|nr:hypothetical protein [Streptomyces sp. 5-10]MBD3004829.1 hypothetical protein [Streptomyces sp. 5-10]